MRFVRFYVERETFKGKQNH